MALLEQIKDSGKQCTAQAPKRGLNSVKWRKFPGSWDPPAEFCAQMWLLWSPWTHSSSSDETTSLQADRSDHPSELV